GSSGKLQHLARAMLRSGTCRHLSELLKTPNRFAGGSWQHPGERELLLYWIHVWSLKRNMTF
ncbi:hypothetical protein, partial [Paenibacillus odorifer]